MKIVFLDANETLAIIADEFGTAFDLKINRLPDIDQDEIPSLIGDASVVMIDHTQFPTELARQCKKLRHVIFLGTGARSYMNPEELSEFGIAVHTIKGYGDTAVAECAFALMWAGARSLARMDREMRSGNWLRSDGLQMTGKTIGLIGFGGIAAEMARLAAGCGMKVLAWNRSAKTHPNVEFVEMDRLLAESHVVSLHLALNDETRGFLSRECIASMRQGAILVNTARGAVIDEAAMIDALASGHLAHAALDVFEIEPLPDSHPLTLLPNVTLSAHSAFRTQEASENLIRAAFDHCRRILGG